MASSAQVKPGQAGTVCPGHVDARIHKQPVMANPAPPISTIGARAGKCGSTISWPYQRTLGRCTKRANRHNKRFARVPMSSLDPSQLPPGHRSGFVAICGRPNVGKSTLLNALIGEPVAVATALPQTTRERFLGIWTKEHFQAVLVDTPGIHRARSALNRYMVAQAKVGATDVDLILLLAEVPAVKSAQAARDWTPGDVALEALDLVRDLGAPIVLILTKLDRLQQPELALPMLETWAGLHGFSAIVPTSAQQNQGLEEVERVVVEHLPEGPRYYDPDDLSDRNLRWHAAELIRAELFEQLQQELPYSCAVQITRFNAQPDRDEVQGIIYVERDSQKGMVIGKGAQTIRSISSAGRARISRLTGRPCHLRLEVKVAKNWTRDPEKLQQLGYKDPSGVS